MKPEQNENTASEIVVYSGPHEKMMSEKYKSGDFPVAGAMFFCLCFFAFLNCLVTSKVLGYMIFETFYPYEVYKIDKYSTIAGLIIGLVFCVALLISVYW